MIELVLKWAVPFVCGAAVSAAVSYFAFVRALRAGVQCLLRAEIIRSHDKYVARGACPVHVKEALRREYKAYKALGGNDVATEMYKKLLSLPSVDVNGKEAKKDEAAV